MAGWLGWLAGLQPAWLPGCLPAWLTAAWLPDWGRVAAWRRRELSAARPPPQRKLRTHPPPNALVFLRLEVYELRGSGFMLVISPDMGLGYFMVFMCVCVCVCVCVFVCVLVLLGLDVGPFLFSVAFSFRVWNVMKQTSNNRT